MRESAAGAPRSGQESSRDQLGLFPSFLTTARMSQDNPNLTLDKLTLSDEVELKVHPDYNAEDATLVLVASESVLPRSSQARLLTGFITAAESGSQLTRRL